jgi:hypothetical protein
MFGNLQNFSRTNTFNDNAVRKFYGATRLATNRFKCRCTIKLSIARLTIRFLICLCSSVGNKIVYIMIPDDMRLPNN